MEFIAEYFVDDPDYGSYDIYKFESPSREDAIREVTEHVINQDRGQYCRLRWLKLYPAEKTWEYERGS